MDEWWRKALTNNYSRVVPASEEWQRRYKKKLFIYRESDGEKCRKEIVKMLNPRSFHEIFSARYKYGNQKLFNMKSRIQENINGN